MLRTGKAVAQWWNSDWSFHRTVCAGHNAVVFYDFWIYEYRNAPFWCKYNCLQWNIRRRGCRVRQLMCVRHIMLNWIDEGICLLCIKSSHNQVTFWIICYKLNSYSHEMIYAASSDINSVWMMSKSLMHNYFQIVRISMVTHDKEP